MTGARQPSDEITQLRSHIAALEQLLEIHERTTIEQSDRLELERARLRTVFAQAPAVIAVYAGPEHVIRMANPMWEKFIGKPAILGKPLAEVLPELVAQGLTTILDQVYASGEPFVAREMRIDLQRQAGSPAVETYWNFVLQPLTGVRGEMEGILAHAVEVTEQVESRRQVERLEQRLRLALESARIGTWDYDLVSGILSWDESSRQIFGVTMETEVSYDLFVQQVHPEDRERTDLAVQAALSPDGGGELDVEYRSLSGHAGVRWIRSRGRAFFGGEGEHRAPLRFTGTVLDVTEEKRAEAERERLIRDLSASNRELDQFAYVASHDLKAPLRGIANLSQWIREDLGGDIPPETSQHIDLLQGRVHRMEALIDGILAYSRAGRVRETVETVQVGSLIADAVEMLAPPAGVAVEVAPDMPTLEAERMPLQQLFMNLIGNAIKYTRRSDAVVRVGVRDVGDAWEFSVADNGPGIAPEYHERIFAIFQTLEARDKVEGTGIGLSLVRKIVESRGGRVWVESQEGAGATFRFLWPKQATEES